MLIKNTKVGSLAIEKELNEVFEDSLSLRFARGVGLKGRAVFNRKNWFCGDKERRDG